MTTVSKNLSERRSTKSEMSPVSLRSTLPSSRAQNRVSQVLQNPVTLNPLRKKSTAKELAVTLSESTSPLHLMVATLSCCHLICRPLSRPLLFCSPVLCSARLSTPFLSSHILFPYLLFPHLSSPLLYSPIVVVPAPPRFQLPSGSEEAPHG